MNLGKILRKFYKVLKIGPQFSIPVFSDMAFSWCPLQMLPHCHTRVCYPSAVFRQPKYLRHSCG